MLKKIFTIYSEEEIKTFKADKDVINLKTENIKFVIILKKKDFKYRINQIKTIKCIK